jgi:hypothetical protein
MAFRCLVLLFYARRSSIISCAISMSGQGVADAKLVVITWERARAQLSSKDSGALEKRVQTHQVRFLKRNDDGF